MLGRVAIWFVAAAVVVAAFAVAVTAVTTPGCTACHGGEEFLAATADSAHATLTCPQCHVPNDVAGRLSFAGTQVFGMTLRLVPVGGRASAAVADATCLSCHEAVSREVTRSKGYRIRHETCAEDSACVDCHSNTAHGTQVSWLRTAQMDECLVCHSTQEVSRNCALCHDDRDERQRLATGSWQVTHGANWEQTHGMGENRTCAACHPGDYCVRCHEVELPHGDLYIRRHAAEAAQKPAACEQCHARRFCDDCHGMEMPHPEEFPRSHSGIVDKDGEELCARCHVKSDCDDCHARHVHPGGAVPFGTTTITVPETTE